MPPPPNDEPEEKTQKAIIFAKVTIITLRLIEEAMNHSEMQKTGLTKLTAAELKNLNEWFTGNAVLSPGPINEIIK